MIPRTQEPPPGAGHNLLLWVGVLAGPSLWLLQMEAVYALSMRACLGGGRIVLHLLELACLLLVAGSGWLSWRVWRSAGEGWPSGEDEGAAARARFLCVVGMMTAAMFSLVLIAQWIAIALLDPCPV
jgi:hypothetical protein